MAGVSWQRSLRITGVHRKGGNAVSGNLARRRVAAVLTVVILPAVALAVIPSAAPVVAGGMTMAPTASIAAGAPPRHGSGVEITDQRTETRTVYANRDGTTTAEIAALALQPGHFESRNTAGWSNPNEGIP